MTTMALRKEPLPSPFSLCHSEESQHWAHGLYLQPKNSLFSPQSRLWKHHCVTRPPDSLPLCLLFLITLITLLAPPHLGHSARIADTFPSPRGCWSSWPLLLLGLPSCFALGTSLILLQAAHPGTLRTE